ncbi:hypothetical protein L208DRAFT_1380125 [Tricholoma matsutake]|nr:hypothetical protein L208DRAFT_1380125 [Tricholoma matsutake 945]
MKMEIEPVAKYYSKPHSSLSPDIWGVIKHLTTQMDALANENCHLHKQYQITQDGLQTMQKELPMMIRTSNETITATIETISCSGPSLSSVPSASLVVPSLKSSDCPNIKFWFKSQFIEVKKNKKTSTGLMPSEEDGNRMTCCLPLNEITIANSIQQGGVVEIIANDCGNQSFHMSALNRVVVSPKEGPITVVSVVEVTASSGTFRGMVLFEVLIKDLEPLSAPWRLLLLDRFLLSVINPVASELAVWSSCRGKSYNRREFWTTCLK